MRQKIMSFTALAITILYGVGFAAFDTNAAYAALGGGLVAIAWIAAGTFGRSGPQGEDESLDREPRR